MSNRNAAGNLLALLAALAVGGCGDSGGGASQSGETGGSTAAGGTSAGGGPTGGASAGGSPAGGASAGGSSAGGAAAGGSSAGGVSSGGASAGGAPSGATTATHEEVTGWIDAYKAAHTGNGGKDWDINAKTPAEIAADPDAQRLLSLCGDGQRPVIPALAWEYGGADHPWISPEASALVYCVYVPTAPNSDHWQYDPVQDHVTADVYVLFPDQNPCASNQGADQVAACIGDVTNFEILVDIASLNDGVDAGLQLSQASSELRLILPDGTIVPHLVDNA